MKEIMLRRSVRKFKNEPVSDQMLEKLLRAAMRAPSAGNEQPWEFVVIRDREQLDQMLATNRYYGPLQSAPCAIVVCGNKQRQVYPADFWPQDCAAATQNLLIEAQHLGLGAVWQAAFPDPKRVGRVSAQLELPEHVLPLNVIAVGYPEEIPEPMDTYQPDRIHYEKW